MSPPLISKAAARYTGAGGREHCSLCRHFSPRRGGRCARVLGDISPRGWCRLFSREMRGLVADASSFNGGAGGPTLGLDFMVPGVLDPRITFTRASTATYFDSAGVMRNAATNVVTNSGSLSDFGPGNATRTLNSATAPDGTTTALRLTEDTTATTEHYLDFTAPVIGNTTYTGSVYVKAGTRTRFGIAFRAGASWVGGNAIAVANLTAGTITVTTGTPTATIQDVGSGWFRISITATTVAAPAANFPFRLNLADDTGSITYTGNGTGNGFFSGAQFQQGSAATPYIATTTTPMGAPRWDYDPATLALRGLLIEEARTNLVSDFTGYTVSNLTYSGSAGIAPDGTNSMGRLTEIATGTVHFTARAGTATTASTAYTFSCFARAQQNRYLQLFSDDGSANGAYATFDLQTGTVTGALTARGTGVIGTATIQAVGGGTYRLGITTTIGTGTTYRTGLAFSNVANPGFVPIYTGNAANGLLVWGAQLEVGAFATSYIPTTSAAVTRAQDRCSISAANMAPWFNALIGSWFAEFVFQNPTSPNIRILASLGQAAGGSAGMVFVDPAQHVAQYDGGTALVTTSPALVVNAVSKAASTWAAGTGQVCGNGGAVLSGAMPSGFGNLSVVGICFLIPSNPGVTDNATGYLRRVSYWSRVLTAADMQAMTAP